MGFRMFWFAPFVTRKLVIAGKFLTMDQTNGVTEA